jgi:hypothetical protein
MTTRNPYQLGVSLPNALPFFPTVRKWRYATEFEGGFRFLEASATTPEEQLETQSEYTFTEVVNVLLGLIEPIRLMTAQELEKQGLGLGWAIREDLVPSEVVELMNEFGQIGLGDYLRRAQLQRPHTIDKGELTPEQAIVILGIHYKYLSKVKKVFKEEPKKWRLMINKIQRGDLIPFAWIEKDLFDLAKCLQILLILDKNVKEGDTFLSLPTLHTRRLRRFLLASELVFLPRGKDETYNEKKDFWLVDSRKIEAKWREFAYNLNRFLTPITFNAVKRESGSHHLQKSLGIETWIIYEWLKSKASLLDKRCERKNCQKPFVALRSNRRYCGDTCSGIERTIEWRKKRREQKKISSGKSQRKSKAKGQRKNAKT